VCVYVCQFQTYAYISVCAVQVDDYKLTERGVVGLKNLGNTVGLKYLQIDSNLL